MDPRQSVSLDPNKVQGEDPKFSRHIGTILQPNIIILLLQVTMLHLISWVLAK
jgi:hypothetical protein